MKTICIRYNCVTYICITIQLCYLHMYYDTTVLHMYYEDCRYTPYRFMLTSISIDSKDYKLTETTSALIAFSCNLEILKWARSNGCQWDEDVYSSADRVGHILKWAIENGCQWDMGTSMCAANIYYSYFKKFIHIFFLYYV